MLSYLVPVIANSHQAAFSSDKEIFINIIQRSQPRRRILIQQRHAPLRLIIPIIRRFPLRLLLVNHPQMRRRPICHLPQLRLIGRMELDISLPLNRRLQRREILRVAATQSSASLPTTSTASRPICRILAVSFLLCLVSPPHTLLKGTIIDHFFITGDFDGRAAVAAFFVCDFPFFDVFDEAGLGFGGGDVELLGVGGGFVGGV